MGRPHFCFVSVPGAAVFPRSGATGNGSAGAAGLPLGRRWSSWERMWDALGPGGPASSAAEQQANLPAGGQTDVPSAPGWLPSPGSFPQWKSKRLWSKL